MIKEAIYHRPKNEFAYAIDERTIHLRLKTKMNDVDKVTIIFGDPYDYNQEEKCWISTQKDMIFNGSDGLHDYWLVSITPSHRRLRYGFLLRDEKETLYFTEKGFYQEQPKESGFYFCFPFLNRIDVFTPPVWVNHTTWYQIFPERFANGDSTINPNGTLPWGSTAPTPTNYFGGDFQGVIDHLDYLEQLGINGLYFTPIFKAHSNHKYDTIDYMEIDPQFGDKTTFKKLVKECHKKGIRVMLDAVFNHSGFYWRPFQDVLEKGEKSRYKDWFHLHQFPIKPEEPGNYDTFAYVPSMPKLNTENEEVKKYLLNVARYWIEEFDIDGWRLDVANEVDHAFWREFRRAVKKVKSDAYILGEIWHDSMPWLQGDQFDAVMNYPLTTAITEYFAKATLSTSQFANTLTSIRNLYPETVNNVQFNLLGSHDTPRILTISQNNKEKVQLQMLVQFTMAGTPCIYYGDEISMTGDQDPGCRKCMIWNKEEQDLEMFSFTQKLISLRNQQKLLRSDKNFAFLEASNEENTIIYRKKDDDNEILIFINNNDINKDVNVPIAYQQKQVVNLWNDEKKSLAHTIRMKAYGFCIVKLLN
ncbi:glycoside hydrolase family 13 protein [Halalkalibacter alkalisediminis]|uniref:Glycoside hydrolase family 13 protein n=1 Tax=Halalkalibacter alkalisediminis TaxID=935616 RepID=A0ABV6NFB2_9BACI|nr:glycoside hydrolase family 13 protein [Halalkalibacter alkalisediminis]